MIKTIFYFIYETITCRGIKTSITTESNNKKAHIILNSSSLELPRINNNDLILCCNDFCNSGLFLKIKPKIYVLADPVFFANSTTGDALVRKETINGLVKNTEWPMDLWVPLRAKRTMALNLLKKNKLISIKFFSNVPLPKNYLIASALFNCIGIFPYCINVSIPMLSICIKKNIKEIELHGLSLSYYKNFLVNKDNSTTIKSDYFYDTSSKKNFMIYSQRKGGYIRGTSLDFFSNIAKTIEVHYLLKKICTQKKINVTNKSPESIVDCWDKIK